MWKVKTYITVFSNEPKVNDSEKNIFLKLNFLFYRLLKGKIKLDTILNLLGSHYFQKCGQKVKVQKQQYLKMHFFVTFSINMKALT
jgi:hypothetical protein